MSSSHMVGAFVASRRAAPHPRCIAAAPCRAAVALLFVVAPLAARAQATSTSQEVALETLLAHAEENAPAIKVAIARAAFAGALQVGAAPFFSDNPEVSALAGPRISNGVGVDAEIGISQRFEIAGEPFLRREVAKRSVDVLQAELEVVRWDLHREVHTAFHQALVARARRDAFAEAEGFAAELVAIAAARAKAGDISPLQETQARIEHARARQGLRAAEQEHASAKLALAETTGWPIATPPEPKGTLGSPKRAQTQAHLLEVANARQAQLIARAREVEVAHAALELAEREGWPEPAIGASYGVENARVGPFAADHIALVSVSIPLPLWQRNQGERARALASLALAEAELAAHKTRIPARLARTRARVDAAAERIEAYEKDILPSVQKSLGLLRRAFELGEADLTEVMVGRERFLAARRESLDAHDEYFSALGELEAEIGADEADATSATPAAPPASPIPVESIGGAQ